MGEALLMQSAGFGGSSSTPIYAYYKAPSTVRSSTLNAGTEYSYVLATGISYEIFINSTLLTPGESKSGGKTR